MPLHVSSTMCSSSGVQNYIIQHLVSSHSVGGRPVNRMREDSLLRLLLCVQCKTPDDRQSNCPKRVEFYYKNKFQKLVHLVGFYYKNTSNHIGALYDINITALCCALVVPNNKLQTIHVIYIKVVGPFKC